MSTSQDIPEPPTGDAWTEARLEHLRRRWVEDGASAGLIGRELGVSRNAVIGKVFRQGWQRRAASGPREKLVRRLAKPRQARAWPKPRAVAAAAPPRRIAAAEAALDLGRDLPADAAPVAFIDLAADRCVWPIEALEAPGHARMLCCGAPIADDKPYCAAHAARSRRDTPPIQVEPLAAAIHRFAA